jgi:hypothetical protein
MPRPTCRPSPEQRSISSRGYFAISRSMIWHTFATRSTPTLFIHRHFQPARLGKMPLHILLGKPDAVFGKQLAFILPEAARMSECGS